MGIVLSDDEKVQGLISAVDDAAFDMDAVRTRLRWVLEDELWREFLTPNGNRMVNGSFAEFVTAPMWQGLDSTIETVRTIAGGDIELLDLLDQALQQEPGNPTGRNQHSPDRGNVNNVNSSSQRPVGNTETAALRRLRKDQPDLHAQVLAGELSAHAAMVQAGYRPRTITIRTDNAASIARTLRKHLTPDVLTELANHHGIVIRPGVEAKQVATR